jgi:hypothetical protein
MHDADDAKTYGRSAISADGRPFANKAEPAFLWDAQSAPLDPDLELDNRSRPIQWVNTC